MSNHPVVAQEEQRAARYWRIRTAVEFVKLAAWTLIQVVREALRVD